MARSLRDGSEDERDAGLPILADALEDAGADARTAGLFRSRNRWALRALLEHSLPGSS